MNLLPILQQVFKPPLRDPLGQRTLHPQRLVTENLDVVLSEMCSVTGPMRQLCLMVDQMVGNDVNLVSGVLVRPIQVQVGGIAAGDRSRPLQEVILALAPLDTARRRRSVVMGEVGQLAHEASPIDAPVVVVLALFALELRSPEEVDCLRRDVVASGAQGVAKLLLAHSIAPLGVKLAESLSKLLTVVDEAVHEGLRDMAHVTLLSLVRSATHIDARPVDEVGELLKTDGALLVLVDGPNQHFAFIVVHLDPHLVEDLLQVLREDETGLA
mmetsp:Transcript_52786/g.112997  ORF Transcript_52786/g.112997 Transcript_52786/m.112997 type:complete len:270 (-) Transcript_52786:927-1736(-)